MRIGYLVQQFPPEVGAGAARASENALHWKQRGADVTIITGMPNRPVGRIDPRYRGRAFVVEEWQGLKVLRGWLYASPRPGFARTVLNNMTFMATALVQALTRTGALDVLIASSPPFFPHIAGVVTARLKRIALVLEVRDLWPDYLIGMGLLKEEALQTAALFALERRLLKAADGVVTVTNSFRNRLIGKGVESDRISVIPNGVDPSFYVRRNAANPPVDALSRSGSEFLLGYLGNFGAGQELPVLVEAIRLLREEGHAVRLVLTGDGPDRGRIMQTIAACRLEATVNMTPPIPKSVTPDFYAACDACLVPLAAVPVLQETVPSKIFEIMACERPVIGCLSGEGARILVDSGGGTVAAPGNARAIATAISGVQRMDASERAELGRRGRAYVLANFNRKTLADKYLQFLGDIAARTSGP